MLLTNKNIKFRKLILFFIKFTLIDRVDKNNKLENIAL